MIKGGNTSSNTTLKALLTLPVSLLYNISYGGYYDDITNDLVGSTAISTINTATDSMTKGVGTESSSSTYSTTNVQVENVDEADVTKTDGKYIYSLSEDKIVITDVRDIDNAKIVSKTVMSNNAIPNEILLYKDKMVVIGETERENTSISWRIWSGDKTNIEVFDISDKTNPKSIKKIEIDSEYYTCRCINGNVYVLSSGHLNKDSDDKVSMDYTEDYEKKKIATEDIYYIEDLETLSKTIITGIDLNNLNKGIDMKAYLIDLNSAYVSQNNIYLAQTDYEYNSNIPIKSIFGFKGLFGITDEENYTDFDSGNKTTIYKFSMNGTKVDYVAKVKDNGQTINQFSMDEYNGNLRVAMYDDDGTRVTIYDQSLKKIGTSENLAKGERMYSSRFIGNRAYLVTYRTVDPLYVLDLSNPTNPKTLGELKIPGYSTYLHPYDDNHIIGIGMETKETVIRDLQGYTSTVSKIVGMKMALFDVTDVYNPKQISTAIIGDSRTTSAILTNHKALLFSKEKNLIAIPINNYESDFSIDFSSENIESIISRYNNNSENYIAEGYEVYNIELENGFTKKGTIVHDLEKQEGSYYYRTITHLLRGLYIDDNLYTVSENMIKINRLSDLEEIKSLRISDALNY